MAKHDARLKNYYDFRDSSDAVLQPYFVPFNISRENIHPILANHEVVDKDDDD